LGSLFLKEKRARSIKKTGKHFDLFSAKKRDMALGFYFKN